ncbi:polymorphic toxin type 30 domain-containing protein [Streptomyces erythrochromogenes]|uniref:polymorphic toxin type 30 domain-containing protein n=1 Tax=Streptomyces erythrochromogenes TaxID=285574 RepID=UPI00386BA4F8|nr:polymorphic toxin type 30 domain-containing protein [Streptomyces erythrochromogenes]
MALDGSSGEPAVDLAPPPAPTDTAAGKEAPDAPADGGGTSDGATQASEGSSEDGWTKDGGWAVEGGSFPSYGGRSEPAPAEAHVPTSEPMPVVGHDTAEDGRDGRPPEPDAPLSAGPGVADEPRLITDPPVGAAGAGEQLTRDQQPETTLDGAGTQPGPQEQPADSGSVADQAEEPLSAELGAAPAETGPTRLEGGGWDLTDGHNPMDVIPPGATQLPFTPDPGNGAQVGVNYKWTDPVTGTTARLRVHDADGTAPEGSNSANGDIYRISIAGRYQDESGKLYHRKVSNPDSPHYDAQAANLTHVPWPEGHELPYEARDSKNEREAGADDGTDPTGDRP